MSGARENKAEGCPRIEDCCMYISSNVSNIWPGLLANADSVNGHLGHYFMSCQITANCPSPCIVSYSSAPAQFESRCSVCRLVWWVTLLLRTSLVSIALRVMVQNRADILPETAYVFGVVSHMHKFPVAANQFTRFLTNPMSSSRIRALLGAPDIEQAKREAVLYLNANFPSYDHLQGLGAKFCGSEVSEAELASNVRLCWFSRYVRTCLSQVP